MKKKKTENQTKLSFALRFVCLAFCDLFSLWQMHKNLTMACQEVWSLYL